MVWAMLWLLLTTLATLISLIAGVVIVFYESVKTACFTHLLCYGSGWQCAIDGVQFSWRWAPEALERLRRKDLPVDGMLFTFTGFSVDSHFPSSAAARGLPATDGSAAAPAAETAQDAFMRSPVMSVRLEYAGLRAFDLHVEFDGLDMRFVAYDRQMKLTNTSCLSADPDADVASAGDGADAHCVEGVEEAPSPENAPVSMVPEVTTRTVRFVHSKVHFELNETDTPAGAWRVVPPLLMEDELVRRTDFEGSESESSPVVMLRWFKGIVHRSVHAQASHALSETLRAHRERMSLLGARMAWTAEGASAGQGALACGCASAVTETKAAVGQAPAAAETAAPSRGLALGTMWESLAHAAEAAAAAAEDVLESVAAAAAEAQEAVEKTVADAAAALTEFERSALRADAADASASNPRAKTEAAAEPLLMPMAYAVNDIE